MRVKICDYRITHCREAAVTTAYALVSTRISRFAMKTEKPQ